MDRRHINYEDLKNQYRAIIYSCDIESIDERCRKAVSQAIKLLLLDISNASRVRIGDNYIPVEIVKKDLERINFPVIQYALDRFKESSRIREIRNPVSYFKVLIYNSINEMDTGVDAKLRYQDLID